MFHSASHNASNLNAPQLDASFPNGPGRHMSLAAYPEGQQIQVL